MTNQSLPNKIYRIVVSERAKKSLKRLPQKIAFKIVFRFYTLALDPYQGKKLSGELQGLLSLRVWPFRIIYQLFDKKRLVEIVDIGYRQGIYK